MNRKKTGVADLLLDAHVRFILDELSGERLQALIERELDAALYAHQIHERTRQYYRTLIDAGIDAVFDRYGDSTLLDLLQDFGITRQLVLAEALRYAPPVLQMLKKKKLLEPVIRRNLQGFYRSGAVETALA